MGQASEFMFIIAAEMFLIGSITHDFYSFLLSIVVVSIVITPYFARGRGVFYEFFSRFRLPKIHHFIHPKSIHVLENPPDKILEDHIILFGAHRMGEKIVQYLKDRGEKLVVVERDPEIVKSLSRKGIHVRYGDAENEEILKKIFLTRAKLLILTIPYADVASFVIRKAKRSHPQVRILARAHTEVDAERLYKAGADIVIIPEFVSAEKIVKKIEHFLREKKL
ncbi:MAG: NAD-binding protein, partial [Candidatus Aenigmarchaeota archaeon]|nr:NAD-binding protein [Candidatus Aenigmarchaeota archaeon]